MTTLNYKLVKCRPVLSYCKRLSVSPQSSHVFENHLRKRFIQVTSCVAYRREANTGYHPCQRNSSLFRTPKILQGHQNSLFLINRTLSNQSEPHRKIAGIREPEEKKIPKENIPLTLQQKLVERCPARFQPYLKLSRIDRPIGLNLQIFKLSAFFSGTWLLFWPSTWGLVVASEGLPDLTLLALFGAGAFVMRGAGCTVNDMWDRHIDPKVRRTSSRPLASRQLRMRHATAWLGVQLSVAFGILLQLHPSCFLISCGALGLVCLYPLAKRVTHWPQAVLGLTFNTGILIGFAAAYPFNTGIFDVPYLDPTCLSLYISGMLWTLIYDTIYAHQDLQDDTLLGLGSTARRFGDHTKLWLSGFSCLMISNLTMAGIYSDLTWLYYAGLQYNYNVLEWLQY